MIGDSFGTSRTIAREAILRLSVDAASDLASWINDYKKSEIKARIVELEATELPDPEARRRAFAKVP